MAKQASIVCMNCGKEITQPAKFCPYCAAALPGTEEKEEHGYWDFYGAAPDIEDQKAGPIGARGWLRFIAICVIMFDGAKRLEKRQMKRCGNDPEYIHYCDTTPIIIPGVPVYHLVRKEDVQ